MNNAKQPAWHRYGPALATAILLIGTCLPKTFPAHDFVHGFTIGLGLVILVLSLKAMYTASPRKGAN